MGKSDDTELPKLASNLRTKLEESKKGNIDIKKFVYLLNEMRDKAYSERNTTDTKSNRSTESLSRLLDSIN